ncbi:MAG: NAD/NADP octopine/nopaline dehydrogenase family protein [Bacillota bacterium]|nr:NAD/NADP octopine/nopaline dehydrogenase family protein [Bacillota bacterium]
MRVETRFSVLGAGNGGQAMAAHLGVMGFPVTLYSGNSAKLSDIEQAGGLELEGQIQGITRDVNLTGSPRVAAAFADVLMVVVPAFAHRDIARILAPHLHEGHTVVLNPGRTLGAIEFDHTLRQHGCLAQVVVAEAQSLLYACRVLAPGKIRVFSVKMSVPVAALPAWRTVEVARRLRRAFPQFVAASDLLETGLDNIGAVFHPTPTILNLARIEQDESFDYYHEGISPAVARVLTRIDEERLKVARALGVAARTAREWLAEVYGSSGRDLHEAIRNTRAYEGIRAPAEVNTRYILEDVPTGLVPISSLGEMVDVPTPTMDAVIELASAITGQDFRASGRSLRNLGLDGMDVGDLHRFILEGREAVA